MPVECGQVIPGRSHVWQVEVLLDVVEVNTGKLQLGATWCTAQQVKSDKVTRNESHERLV